MESLTENIRNGEGEWDWGWMQDTNDYGDGSKIK